MFSNGVLGAKFTSSFEFEDELKKTFVKKCEKKKFRENFCKLHDVTSSNVLSGG